MNFRPFLKVLTAVSGAALLLLVLESRRQRATQGETLSEATRRNEQATDAFREILRDVQREDPKNLLSHGGIATADITLDALAAVQPSIGQPLLKMYNGVKTVSSVNAFMQSPMSAFATASGFTFPSFGATRANEESSSQARDTSNNEPVVLQPNLTAQGIDPTLLPKELQDQIRDFMSQQVQSPSTATSSLPKLTPG